jgi:hypothetical protein
VGVRFPLLGGKLQGVGTKLTQWCWIGIGDGSVNSWRDIRRPGSHTLKPLNLDFSKEPGPLVATADSRPWAGKVQNKPATACCAKK